MSGNTPMSKKLKWCRRFLHSWQQEDTGYMIQKLWTFGVGKKTSFYLTYLSEDDMQKGNNIGNFPSLTDAKNSFKNLVDIPIPPL